MNTYLSSDLQIHVRVCVSEYMLERNMIIYPHVRGGAKS